MFEKKRHWIVVNLLLSGSKSEIQSRICSDMDLKVIGSLFRRIESNRRRKPHAKGALDFSRDERKSKNKWKQLEKEGKWGSLTDPDAGEQLHHRRRKTWLWGKPRFLCLGENKDINWRLFERISNQIFYCMFCRLTDKIRYVPFHICTVPWEGRWTFVVGYYLLDAHRITLTNKDNVDGNDSDSYLI